jgi:two-component system, OmpR family, KDP operon response regulator KdpE
MTACILIVEDDKDFSRLLQLDLKQNGYSVVAAENGPEGLRLYFEAKPKLVILDIAMPQMNGLEVCRQIRQASTVPILMITGHALSEEEIVAGLEAGADDYLTKPLRKLELQARVKALLRRAEFETSPPTIVGYMDDYLSVDLKTRRVQTAGQEVRLTPTEYKLLIAFIKRPGEVLTFEALLEEVWGAAYVDEHHYPRIYVSHLRRKIERDPQNPVYIQNEYGIGYRFIGKSASSS